jgi:hypothetical protein
MYLRPVVVVIAVLGLGACDNETSPNPRELPGDAGSQDAAEDRQEFCPDPNDPAVHYSSDDPNACDSVTLDCTVEQNGFDNACGCGCIDKGDASCPTIDDGNIVWSSRNPAECSSEPPRCGLNEIGFSNSCGCGCKLPS